ncbi:hypothetical protein EMCRGX_G009377 [Ephydatia muelleri]
MTPLSDWLNVLPRGSGIAGVTELPLPPKAVTRKAWICANPGLSCANPGSMNLFVLCYNHSDNLSVWVSKQFGTSGSIVLSASEGNIQEVVGGCI